ncbi:MAG: oligopeptide:H+ symporter [Pirellulales bacterium]
MFGALLGTIEQWKTDYPSFTAVTSIGILTLLLVLAGIFTASMRPGERGPVATIFILMTFNAVFWLAFEQAGSSVAFFCDEHVDRRIPLLNYVLPTASIHSINPAFILLFGPVMSWIWTALGRRGRNPSQGLKVALALALLGIGFGVLVLVAPRTAADGKAALFWIALMTWFHTIGELCLSPTGLSFVTKTAPIRFLSLLMGIWFVSNFVANLVGGLVAARVKDIEDGKLQLPWELGEGQADFFMLFVVSSFGAALLALALTPLLKRLNPKA